MTALTNPIFTDPEAARQHLEAMRWAKRRFCPHCGEAERTGLVESKKHRPGLYYCRSCEKTFTVTVGTLFERSLVPLNKWMLAFHLMASSKKGMSAHQLHRMLGVTYKTAWFMAHRIREAMADYGPDPIGGEGKTVEADETYFGNKAKITTRTKRGKSGLKSKRAVLSLVEREGQVRSFHLNSATKKNVTKVVNENIRRETKVFTDESKLYRGSDKTFAAHETVHHSSSEYVRGEVHTNTVEGYFSIFKRGMKGVYQHCAEKHLHRYLSEFDFRYNNRIALEVDDTMRAAKALKGIEGKRLTYRRIGR